MTESSMTLDKWLPGCEAPTSWMLPRRVANEYADGSVYEEISCEISECCDACDSWHVRYQGLAQKNRQLMQYADKGLTFNILHGFAPG
jgi:hypothetical protein